MLRITELADRAGTTTRALRYYEEVGLLAPLRSGLGARLYPSSMARTACLIVELRRLDVAVPDIATFLTEIERGGSDALSGLIRRRLAQIDVQRASLSALLDDITSRLDGGGRGE